MPSVSEDTPRTWAGTTLANRRAVRRRQFLDAGLELAGTYGITAVSVRAACRTAKLTERYFYENFSDKDAFLLAVYEDVSEQARNALMSAVGEAGPDPEALVRAAVTAFVELMLDDPRKGSVLLLAPLTDTALAQRGSEHLPAFTALIHDQLPPALDEAERQMIAVGLVGSLANLFIRYLDGSLTVPRDRLLEHCVRLILGAAN